MRREEEEKDKKGGERKEGERETERRGLLRGWVKGVKVEEHSWVHRIQIPFSMQVVHDRNDIGTSLV